MGIRKYRFRLSHAIVVSVVLHFLLLLLYKNIPEDILHPITLNGDVVNEAKPMKFKFTDLKDDIEAEPSPDAKFYSDKSRKASDLKKTPYNTNKPKLDGRISDFMIPSPMQQMRRQQIEENFNRKKDDSTGGSAPSVNKDKTFRESLNSFRESLSSLGLDSAEDGARNFGAISFDTFYADLGPYAKRLRKEIRRNWHPPMAYYTLGLKGDVKVHFNIMKDGKLEDLEIIDSSGEHPLDRSAYYAIYNSFPFESLPDFVKEDKLGATITFRYLQGR